MPNWRKFLKLNSHDILIWRDFRQYCTKISISSSHWCSILAVNLDAWVWMLVLWQQIYKHTDFLVCSAITTDCTCFHLEMLHISEGMHRETDGHDCSKPPAHHALGQWGLSISTAYECVKFTLPHALQWCLLLKTEKVTLHLWHSLTAWSGNQVGAVLPSGADNCSYWLYKKRSSSYRNLVKNCS